MSGTLRPTMPVPEAGRRLLLDQYRLIIRNQDGAAQGDVLAVHDFRAAIRRASLLLRTFRSSLEGSSARHLRRSLRRFHAAFGPGRDTDVWIAMLERLEGSWRSSGDSGYARYRRTLLRLRERHARAAARLIRSSRYRSLRAECDHFLTRDVAPPPRKEAGERFSSFAARKLAQSVRRMGNLRRVSARLSPAKLHTLRKACRRARYQAEFFKPLYGSWGADLSRRLRRLATILGEIHDIDLGMSRMRRGFPDCPRELQLRLAERRRKELKRFHAACKDWNSKTCAREVEKRLAGK